MARLSRQPVVPLRAIACACAAARTATTTGRPTPGGCAHPTALGHPLDRQVLELWRSRKIFDEQTLAQLEERVKGAFELAPLPPLPEPAVAPAAPPPAVADVSQWAGNHVYAPVVQLGGAANGLWPQSVAPPPMPFGGAAPTRPRQSSRFDQPPGLRPEDLPAGMLPQLIAQTGKRIALNPAILPKAIPILPPPSERPYAVRDVTTIARALFPCSLLLSFRSHRSMDRLIAGGVPIDPHSAQIHPVAHG